uniref:polynucleotide adenylyltransferase n=1 Tax=Nothobranchius kuhntae TaxID=321403 RepID=A0A1A8IMN1_NOTKU
MDESKSAVKSVKLSQPRGAKALSSQKSNKEASVQREGVKSALRSKENLTAAKDERSVGQAGRTPGNTLPDSPVDKKRGRPSRLARLSGRTSSGESGKGKDSHQQLVAPESQSPLSVDNSSSSANRGTTSSPIPFAPERGRQEQDQTSAGAAGKEKSHVIKAAALMPQSAREDAEVRPALDEKLTEQQLGLRQVEERLHRDHIHRLVKQSPEYPNYLYFCKLCSVHIDNFQGAYKHIKEKRHKKNLVEKQEENELLALPPPSAAQLRALDSAVLETTEQHGVSEEDLDVRKAAVVRMEEIIKRHLPACSLRLYGSCLTRFAFKTSDVNVDVTFPPTMTQPEVLIQVLGILKNSPEFTEVESDFHTKVPAVFCRDRDSGLLCKVSAGNDVACLTTNHLAALAKLEPRLVPLVLTFRYWARLCHIDCQAEGGIPSYSFALMVIFFLQQRKEPVLPVYLGPWIEGFDVKRVDEYHLTGIVQDTFVKWERRSPSSAEERGDNRNESKSKPELKKSEEARASQGQSRLTLNPGRDASLGQLWLELLRFYTLEFAPEEYIISIRLKELLSREVKNWPRRRLAVEDPFSLKRNVARSLNSQMVFEYVQECFRSAYKYFASPQRKSVGGQPRKEGAGAQVVRKGERCLIREEDRRKSDTSQRGRQEEHEESDGEDEEGLDSSRKMGKKIPGVRLTAASDGNKPSSSPNGLLDSDEEEESSVSEKDASSEGLHYEFNKMVLTGGKPPAVVCSICKRDGHQKDECPEDFKKIELNPLPPMNERFRNILDGLCRLCYCTWVRVSLDKRGRRTNQVPSHV